MIIELADFRAADAADFETAMGELIDVLAVSAGYRGHTVQRSIESPGRYVLLVRWDSVDAHMGFRDSDRFTTWRERIASHREGIVVEHFETVLSNDWDLEG